MQLPQPDKCLCTENGDRTGVDIIMIYSYTAIHPVVRQVLKMTFMEVPLAGRLLLWLTPALVGGCNLSLNMHQNIANDWMNNAVFTSRSRRPSDHRFPF